MEIMQGELVMDSKRSDKQDNHFFFSNLKETGQYQAERYFLICMKRIAELSGKLGYLVIMSKSEKDNKSRRAQATLSRSDCSLGRIRTN